MVTLSGNVHLPCSEYYIPFGDNEAHKLEAQVGGYTIRYSCGALPIPRASVISITEFDRRCHQTSNVNDCENAFRRVCLRRDAGSTPRNGRKEASGVSVDCAQTVRRSEERDEEQCTLIPARGSPHGPTNTSPSWDCTSTTTFTLPIGLPPSRTPVTVPTLKPLPTPAPITPSPLPPSSVGASQ